MRNDFLLLILYADTFSFVDTKCRGYWRPDTLLTSFHNHCRKKERNGRWKRTEWKGNSEIIKSAAIAACLLLMKSFESSNFFFSAGSSLNQVTHKDCITIFVLFSTHIVKKDIFKTRKKHYFVIMDLVKQKLDNLLKVKIWCLRKQKNHFLQPLNSTCQFFRTSSIHTQKRWVSKFTI